MSVHLVGAAASHLMLLPEANNAQATTIRARPNHTDHQSSLENKPPRCADTCRACAWLVASGTVEVASLMTTPLGKSRRLPLAHRIFDSPATLHQNEMTLRSIFISRPTKSPAGCPAGPSGRRLDVRSGGRATHRHAVHTQGRLTDTDRHALAVLAAHADALVQRQVVADHRHAREYVRAAADQRGAFDRAGDLAVFDEVGLRRGEHELAIGDIDLTAAEVHRVQALFHRTDDFLRIVLAGQHVGIGHAWHRQLREGFTATIAGSGHAHQARVELVLHVALEDAVLDQRGALGRRAFIVHTERAAPAWQGAVVDHGDTGRRNALADPSGKRRTALAVEVAFQAMTDRFVQQHARPAGTEHYRHRSGGGIDRIEIDQGLAHRLLSEGHRATVIDQLAVAIASTTTGMTLLAATVLLGDHLHVQAHQGAYVGGQRAIRPGD